MRVSPASGKLAEIRQRLQSGAYDRLEVVDEVARRMIRRGALPRLNEPA